MPTHVVLPGAGKWKAHLREHGAQAGERSVYVLVVSNDNKYVRADFRT